MKRPLWLIHRTRRPDETAQPMKSQWCETGPTNANEMTDRPMNDWEITLIVTVNRSYLLKLLKPSSSLKASEVGIPLVLVPGWPDLWRRKDMTMTEGPIDPWWPIEPDQPVLTQRNTVLLLCEEEILEEDWWCIIIYLLFSYDYYYYWKQ